MAIPNDVLLAAWAPFGAACLLCLLVSLAYLWALCFVFERGPLVLACGTVTLVTSLATVILLPTDVSLVSALKGDDGTFVPWAANTSAQQMVQSQLQHAYYVLYGLLVFLVVLVLPFAYMFLQSDSMEYNGELLTRVVSALKYIGLILVSAGIVLALGKLIPTRSPPPSNSTEWQWDKIRFLVDELATSRSEDSLYFLVSMCTLFGMALLIVYTGFGLAALPLRLMVGNRRAVQAASDVGRQRRTARSRSDSLALHEAGPSWQLSASSEEWLQDSEQEDIPRWLRTAVLEEQPPDTEEASSSLWNGGPLEERLYAVEEDARLNWQLGGPLEEQLPDDVWELHVEHLCRAYWPYRLCFPPRPLQVMLGIVAAMLGLLLWTSLLLSNVDKAMHSLGHRVGYVLPHPTLPNPLDMALVWLQCWSYSLLDLVLVLALLFLLVACTIYGLQRIGISCLFVRMYRLDLGLARPRALLVLCFVLVFVVLALDVLVYSVCPQYATYGSQRFKDVSGTLPCDGDAPPEECVMSRSSAMLVRFFFKAWIFGAAYYWATWLFLGSALVSFIAAIVHCWQSSVEVGSHERKDDESESDESEDNESEPLVRASSVPIIRRYSVTELRMPTNLSF